MQKQLNWFKINYPNIHKGEDLCRTDDQRTGDRCGRRTDGLVFSAPFFDPDGNLAGSVAAVIPTSTLRGITGSENYSLISPLAEYISVPLPRDKNLRLMMRAANSVPSRQNHIFGNGGHGYP